MFKKANEYADKIILKDSTQKIESILLCGSLARGAVSSFSDIDIWVICRKKPKIFNEVFQNSFTIDVRYYTMREIEELIDEEDTEAVGAFVQGIILYDRSFARHLKSKLKNFHFSEKAYNQWIGNAKSYLDDACDLLEREEYKAAKIVLRYAVENAAIALLLRKNVMYPGLKWTYPLMRRFAEEYPVINRLYEEIQGIDGIVDIVKVRDRLSKTSEMITLVVKEIDAQEKAKQWEKI